MCTAPRCIDPCISYSQIRPTCSFFAGWTCVVQLNHRVGVNVMMVGAAHLGLIHPMSSVAVFRFRLRLHTVACLQQ